jgi:hypothetical protein
VTSSALKPVLTDPTINTIVFDSITSFMDRCLTRGIVRVGSTPREKPTNLAPGFRGYGARAMLVRQCVMNIHTLCERYNKSFIATAHEKTEYGKDGQGNEVIDFITMLLGGETFVQVPKNFSEIWRMELTKEGKTAVLTYPHGYYRPCRSRMFRRNEGYQALSLRVEVRHLRLEGRGHRVMDEPVEGGRMSGDPTTEVVIPAAGCRAGPSSNEMTYILRLYPHVTWPDEEYLDFTISVSRMR